MSNAIPHINSIHGSAMPKRAIGKSAVIAKVGGFKFSAPILTIPANANEEPTMRRIINGPKLCKRSMLKLNGMKEWDKFREKSRMQQVRCGIYMQFG
jgi:hypothetical protein